MFCFIHLVENHPKNHYLIIIIFSSININSTYAFLPLSEPVSPYPSSPLRSICKIDAYPDADFAGMYGHEKPVDPSCVKSRTGFVIKFANVPSLRNSQLQTETALSTMEAEIIALLACCRNLLSIINMVESVTSSVKLSIGETTMKLSVHEDNSGALVLAKTLPPQFTPQRQFGSTKISINVVSN